MKILTLPKGSPDPLPELATYLEPFAPLFRRRTSRSSVERYATGLLTDLPRKNCEGSPRRWPIPRWNNCNIC
jgi:hypothetical protein